MLWYTQSTFPVWSFRLKSCHFPAILKCCLTPSWLVQLAGMLDGWMTVWMGGWLAARLISWLCGRLWGDWIACLDGCLSDWLVAWLAGCLAGWLVD